MNPQHPPTKIWIMEPLFRRTILRCRCNLPLFIPTSASQILSGSKQKRYITHHLYQFFLVWSSQYALLVGDSLHRCRCWNPGWAQRCGWFRWQSAGAGVSSAAWKGAVNTWMWRLSRRFSWGKTWKGKCSWKITSSRTAWVLVDFLVGAGGVQRFSLLPIAWCSWGCRGSWRVCIQAQCQAGSFGMLVKDGCMGDAKGSRTGLQSRLPLLTMQLFTFCENLCTAGRFLRAHGWEACLEDLRLRGDQGINFTFVYVVGLQSTDISEALWEAKEASGRNLPATNHPAAWDGRSGQDWRRRKTKLV